MHPRTTPAQLAQIRAAASTVSDDTFVHLLRWHRMLEGHPELPWGRAGTYRQGVLDLRTERAQELLADLRRAARARPGRSADNKPRFAGGDTLAELARRRENEPKTGGI